MSAPTRIAEMSRARRRTSIPPGKCCRAGEAASRHMSISRSATAALHSSGGAPRAASHRTADQRATIAGRSDNSLARKTSGSGAAAVSSQSHIVRASCANSIARQNNSGCNPSSRRTRFRVNIIEWLEASSRHGCPIDSRYARSLARRCCNRGRSTRNVSERESTAMPRIVHSDEPRSSRMKTVSA